MLKPKTPSTFEGLGACFAKLARLRGFESKAVLTIGAWDGLLGAGGDRLKVESLAGLRERERPRGAGGAPSLSRSTEAGAAGGGCSL
ncbi:hypothetical protein PHLCEN_2v2256 [Hermanssonia centrifuga]|uniref:Uncharacterized protein n=1 Tax=Hermanssonia centrifuga TaxID=98765 RepID=A0A2R6RPR1_9APHY|nr:hypothetical protein PHLCEN_2v2256 [Hermanssonia centrifuga]